jgi:predicted  nucleic acid-binding Zn-ribbon protein
MLPPSDYIIDTNRRLLIMTWQSILTKLDNMETNLNKMKETVIEIENYLDQDFYLDKNLESVSSKIKNIKTQLAGSCTPDDRFSN